jgi:hypothetical protein
MTQLTNLLKQIIFFERFERGPLHIETNNMKFNMEMPLSHSSTISKTSLMIPPFYPSTHPRQKRIWSASHVNQLSYDT